MRLEAADPLHQVRDGLVERGTDLLLFDVDAALPGLQLAQFVAGSFEGDGFTYCFKPSSALFASCFSSSEACACAGRCFAASHTRDGL